MKCPKCNYVMDVFDKECPKCHGKGLQNSTPPSVPAPFAPIPESVPEETPQTVSPKSDMPTLTLPHNQFPSHGQVVTDWDTKTAFMLLQRAFVSCCNEVKNTSRNDFERSLEGRGITSMAYKYKVVGSVVQANQGARISMSAKPTFGMDALGQLKHIAPEIIGVFILEQLRQNISNILSSTDGFTCSQQFATFDSGIAFDESNKSFCLISVENEKMTRDQISCDDILDTEIIENANSRSKTLSTGLGSLIGSHSGMGGGLGFTKTTDLVELIFLKITVRDTKRPVRQVVFFDSDGTVERNTSMYQDARQQADHWHALLQQQKGSGVRQQNHGSVLSVADELSKLAELKNNGVITPEEFTRLKENLLSS